MNTSLRDEMCCQFGARRLNESRGSYEFVIRRVPAHNTCGVWSSVPHPGYVMDQCSSSYAFAKV